jgi:hypothetical protein
MRKAILAVALAPLLAGCQPLDAIEGKKSASQIHHERVQALTIVPAVVPEIMVVAALDEVADDPWPVEINDAPDCVPEFRVRTCE